MTELFTAFIIFIVSVVVLQMVALRTYANEVFWARSDYVWLSVAALALISLTAEARKDEARTLIPIQEEHLQGMAAIAEQDVHFSLNYLTFFSEIKVQNQTQEITRQKQEFIELKTRLLPYLEAFSAPSWVSRIDGFHSKQALLSGLSDPMAVSRATSITKGMDRVRSSYSELRGLQERLEVSFLERLRVYLAPLLVAFVLAIRLGKTTAEVKRKKLGAKKG